MITVRVKSGQESQDTHMRYLVVYECTPKEIEQRVNDLARQGWYLAGAGDAFSAGGVFAVMTGGGLRWYATMYRLEQPSPNGGE